MARNKEKTRSSDLNFGLKIIGLTTIVSLIIVIFIIYYNGEYRYINFNKYTDKGVEVIRKRMVKDEYFYKYLLIDNKVNELTDYRVDYILKETILTMYALNSNKLKVIDKDTYKSLKIKNGVFSNSAMSFYIKENELLKQANKLYDINVDDFDITKYKLLQKISANYNGIIYVGLKAKDIDNNVYTIGVKSLKKENDFFVMDCYLYGYDSNIDEKIIKKLKNEIESGNYDYINYEYILEVPIIAENKIVKFKETRSDLDFKYQIIEIENKGIPEY